MVTAALQPDTRSDAIDRFLALSGVKAPVRVAIEGDASFRRYERILSGGRQYILMDAPPQHEDVRPFMCIQDVLLGWGLSAPQRFAQDAEQGFLLLEDLGDSIYSRLLKEAPQQEMAFYTAAVEVLGEIARRPVPVNVPAYDEALMMRELALFTEWFLPKAVPGVSAAEKEAFLSLWPALLEQARRVPQVLVLRDYHADNLLWLKDRESVTQVGLLDFQDAVVGPVTYDLVSLLEDARRDVQPETVEAMLAQMKRQLPQVAAEVFDASYAIMGAQRNIKIIGIFTRLCVRDKKPRYLSLLPRVWAHLEHDLRAPVMAPVAQWLARHVPAEVRGALQP